MLRALRAELLKLKRSNMPLWTAFIVCAAPVFPYEMTKQMYGTSSVGWEAFMRQGPAVLASWYGTVLFSLVTAYVFGREYSDGTLKEMLTLPVRREYFCAAKAVVLVGWVLALTVLSVIAEAVWAAMVGMDGATWEVAAECLTDSLQVAVLILAMLPVVALLAMRTRGYLAPMAYAAVMASLGVGLAEAGWTRWFPWSMQVVVTGVSLFPPVSMPGLVAGSWALMALLFVTGSAVVVWYLDAADTVQ